MLHFFNLSQNMKITMFNKTNIILFTNLLAICLCSTELVKNNGFEKLNKQGNFPNFWAAAYYNNCQGKIILENQNVDSGNSAIQLNQSSFKGYQACNQVIPFKEPLKEAKEITISLRASAAQLKLGYVAIYAGTRKKPQLQWFSLFTWKNTFEWKTFTQNITLKPGAEQLTISIRTAGPGTLWVDNVSIKMHHSQAAINSELLLNSQLTGKISPISNLVPNWVAKMYPGLEAQGNISINKQGYENKNALSLQWVGGARRFGAEAKLKNFSAKDSVFEASAWVKTAPNGSALLGAELFNKEGKSIGEVFSNPLTSKNWEKLNFTFSTTPETSFIRLYCLSNDIGKVLFSSVSCKRLNLKTSNTLLPLDAQLLPVDWSSVWKNGKKEFTSFAQSPLPIGFHLKGESKKLSNPEIVIDLPTELTIADSYNMHVGVYQKETPKKEKIKRPEGDFIRYRFINPKIFKILQSSYGWSRVLCVVITPINPNLKQNSFPVYWHLADGSKRTTEKNFTFTLVPMPPKSQIKPNFSIFRWDADDMLYTNNTILEKALDIFERSGLTQTYRYNNKFKRGMEINAIRDKRNWVHANGLHDHLQTNTIPKKLLAPIKDKLEFRVHTNPIYNKSKFCPDYFTDDPQFNKIVKNFIKETIANMALKDGEMVVMDTEPWDTLEWCFCNRSRKKFAQYQKLNHVPSITEIKQKYSFQWSQFRCQNTAQIIKMYHDVIKEHFPKLKLADYDYIINYSDPNYKTSFYRVAKDPVLNEQYFDAHFASFYHVIDKAAFDMIKIGSRKLKKAYVPNCAIDGPGTFLTASEIINPAQARLMMLASAVNGNKGFAIYKGTFLDGLYHVAFCNAMREISILEKYFNNGRVTAKDLIVNIKPYKTMELKNNNKTQIVGLPHQNVHFAYSFIPVNQDRLATLFNYHPSYPMFVNLKANLPKGNYDVSFPTCKTNYLNSSNKKYWTSEELKKGFIVKINPQDATFILITPATAKNSSNNKNIYQSNIEKEFKTISTQFNNKNFLTSQKSGSLSICNSDINDDGVPELELSSNLQKIWVDYNLGGKVSAWSINNKLLPQTTLAVDKIWLPVAHRQDLTTPMNIKDVKINNQQLILVLEKMIPAMKLKVEKTYTIPQDKIGFSIDYNFTNLNNKDLSLTFWGGNIFEKNAAKVKFDATINNKLTNLTTISGDLFYAVGKKSASCIKPSLLKGVFNTSETFATLNNICISLKSENFLIGNYYYFFTPTIRTWEWMSKNITIAPLQSIKKSIEYSAKTVK